MNSFKINTQRLTIRPLTSEDAMDFHVYRSNPEVTKYQGFDVMDLNQCKAFLQENATKSFGKAGEWVQYGIESNQNQTLIGDCAIKLDAYDTRIAEIGITISHIEQRKGYAKEVLESILDFLFLQKGVLRVVEIVDVENIASIQLLKRVGFRLEGHFIENIFFKGSWGSEYQFAMLKREWDNK